MISFIYITKYIFYPIAIGILSTICYVIIFDQILKKIILPWYFSRKYKSTLIGGNWKGETRDFIFEFKIDQSGDMVNGDIFVQSKRHRNIPGTEKEESYVIASNNYTFIGEIRDGFLRINHKEKDRDSFGFGCFLLKIVGGGKIMNGSVIYINESPHSYEVEVGTKITLKRVTI